MLDRKVAISALLTLSKSVANDALTLRQNPYTDLQMTTWLAANPHIRDAIDMLCAGIPVRP